MIDDNNLHTIEQCRIYYKIINNNIYLVLKQVRFPYGEVNINVYNSWYSDFSYDETLDMIINGGEEYMLETIRKKVREIVKEDNDYNANKTREEQVQKLGTTINIDKDIWRKLRDNY